MSIVLKEPIREIGEVTAELHDAHFADLNGNIVVVGNCKGDTRKRFADGELIRSSTVEAINFPLGLVLTRNSVYRVVNWVLPRAPF